MNYDIHLLPKRKYKKNTRKIEMKNKDTNQYIDEGKMSKV